MIELDSVGSVIDVNKLMVYPLNSDGTVDLYNGVGVEEVDDEWITRLSPRDASIWMYIDRIE